MSDKIVTFYLKPMPIQFREPFAETLGTLNQENVIPINFLLLNREKRFTEEGWRKIRAHV
jgi:hypothetical protein